VNPDVWKRLEEVVDQALALDAADRRALLERLGAEDPELCRRLEAFLAAEVAARGFLDEPVDERAAPLLHAMGDDEDGGDALRLEGQTVGPYRVLRELGRGGMGAVFLAERADGQFEQRVALKLVRRSFAADGSLARFRAERQILARLEHPHIARLLDGGVSESGQPYFAMEHVEGAPLVRYCDEAGLSIAGRLRLFLQVCEAVEYAHRNLVVHRDLKPSNILVTSEGQAKLLDFGIAKVLEPEAGNDSPTVTLLEARAMTPQYAAPEQLLGKPVTTATDVYSLGVVLYELLSGRPPYRLQGLTPAEIERVVTGREPDLLSSAAGAPVSSAATIARARGVGVERLMRLLRGDLDNVVRMALRKEPERRYASASALADDVRRVLDGLPIAARPDTFAYRASKFVRRHTLAVAGATLLVISLLGGVIGTSWQAREALRQARKAEEVKRFAFGLFEVADPDIAKGKEISARQLLERAAQRIRTELSDQPDVEAEMLLFVGNVYHRLGMERESLPLFESALELRRGPLGGDALEVAEAELAVAGARFRLGELEAAEKLYESAFERRRRRLGEDHADTATARGLLGRIRLERDDLAGAENLLRGAIASQERRLPAGHADLAANIGALGRVLQTKGDLDGAERLYRQALAMRRRLFGEQHTSVSEGLLNLAGVMNDKGDVRGAEVQYRQLLANDRRLFGATHEAIATDLNNLGATLVVSGSCGEAKVVLQESLDVRRRLYGADSPQVAVAFHNLARALHCLGDVHAAEALSREALARAVAMLGEHHPNVDRVREELARILADQGKAAEAEKLARQAVATSRQQQPADHPWLGDALLTLGRVLAAARRDAEAEPLLQEATAIFEKRFGARDWRTIEGRLELEECRAALGRQPTSGAALAADYRSLVDALGPQHPLALRAKHAAEVSAGRRPRSAVSPAGPGDLG